MEIKHLPLKGRGHDYGRLHNGDGTVEVLEGTYGPRLMDYLRCIRCDSGGVYRIEDDAVVIQGEPCPCPGDIITTITLQVPSGKIVVTDDLRSFYPIDDEGFASYNTALGQAQEIEARAKAGLAYGPVGNSCPKLYRMAEDHYVIASPGYDDEDEPLIPEDCELASICTDLWAYSIADHDDWVAKGGDPGDMNWTESIVEIPPGTYQFVHYTGMKDFDHHASGTLTFADVRKIA